MFAFMYNVLLGKNVYVIFNQITFLFESEKAHLRETTCLSIYTPFNHLL